MGEWASAVVLVDAEVERRHGIAFILPTCTGSARDALNWHGMGNKQDVYEIRKVAVLLSNH